MSYPIWDTSLGSIGTYPVALPLEKQLLAVPVLPAVTVTYQIISGSLPTGLNMTINGLIYGTPTIITENPTTIFVVRATDNLGKIADRTFSITITGDNVPKFTTPTGTILNLEDSIWTEYAITYSNPITTNPVSIRVVQGELPPGLEINEFGLIRGYAEPPTTTLNLSTVSTLATNTTTSTNQITCISTSGFAINRPVVFTGTVMGGLTAGTTYYIKSIVNSTTFTVTTIQDGPTLALSTGSGLMTVTLPSVSVGEPAIRQYSFSLKLESPLGDDISIYSITVVNQNLSVSLGGPGKPPDTRNPTILNTRPLTYNITTDTDNYGYYLLPPDSSVSVPGMTYNPSQEAYMGQFLSNNYFSFNFLGKDFDNNDLTYYYVGLPGWLTGDSNTGWVYGEPILPSDTIQEFTFSVYVAKTGVSLSEPYAASPTFNFMVRIAKDIDGNIIWVTPTDLGTIYNSTVSIKKVEAISDVDLEYTLVSGSLPNNLTLADNGEILGKVAFQPSDILLEQNESQTYTFTVEASSTSFPTIVASQKTFTLTVVQQYNVPTDSLYIKCTPSIENRELIRSLLDDTSLIPNNMLFRPNDIYFGKAQNVVYQHAYGIYASDLEEYMEAVRKNHYWRNITLGELKTAIARDENNEIVYEVVYSEIIDNLVNTENESVSLEIVWPQTINLNQGPWYTSVTDIYTSYEYNTNSSLSLQQGPLLLTQLNQPILTQQGEPTFYTSLDPGEVRDLYPNSLPNMRKRVEIELGYDPNFRLLPLWMTSQQIDGSTLGFTPAWVICYTKPGYANTIKDNIENDWLNINGEVNKLNQINFKLDRFIVDKSMTFDYDKIVEPNAWVGLPSGSPVPNPLDSQDFYVLFPRKTILPDSDEY